MSECVTFPDYDVSNLKIWVFWESCSGQWLSAPGTGPTKRGEDGVQEVSLSAWVVVGARVGGWSLPPGCGSARPARRGQAEMGTFLGGLVASRVNTQKEGWAAWRLTAEGKPSPICPAPALRRRALPYLHGDTRPSGGECRLASSTLK